MIPQYLFTFDPLICVARSLKKSYFQRFNDNDLKMSKLSNHDKSNIQYRSIYNHKTFANCSNASGGTLLNQDFKKFAERESILCMTQCKKAFLCKSYVTQFLCPPRNSGGGREGCWWPPPPLRLPAPYTKQAWSCRRQRRIGLKIFKNVKYFVCLVFNNRTHFLSSKIA